MDQLLVRGRGCLGRESLTDLMARTGMQRPLLVCSRRMQADFAARTGMTLPLFDGYHPNPDLSDAAAGAELYRAEGCDGLISVGGGSAMDTAKAVKALLLTGDMEAVKANRLPDDVPLPHIAIPGTAGTGAEATPIAVVYVDGQKLSLDHPALLPEGVLLDSALLDTLPLYHKKACAMDALCQGIESFWARQATAESRVHAEKAIRGVLTNLTAYLAGDADAQDAMLDAAWESGRAIRISRTTAAHAMSYQLTKKLGYAHGHACMLTLPHLVIDMMLRQEEGRKAPDLSLLAEIIGVEDGWGIARILLGLLAETDMLAETAVHGELLSALVDSVNVQRLGNHPVQLTKADLRSVYAGALQHLSVEAREAYAALWRSYDETHRRR